MVTLLLPPVDDELDDELEELDVLELLELLELDDDELLDDDPFPPPQTTPFTVNDVGTAAGGDASLA